MNFVNHYPGVNPHLNSALQSPGGDWDTFHFSFMSNVGDTLDALLPENYFVDDDTSLQIRGWYDEQTHEEDRLSRISIDYMYPVHKGRRCVFCVELLHPATKASREMRVRYHSARAQLTDCCLLEIDLLHEISPLYDDTPDYSRHFSGAMPYSLTFVDLLWDTHQHHAFGIGDRFPVLEVPLRYQFQTVEPPLVSIDLNPAYQKTLESRRIFSLLTDYTREPEHIETYSAADQAFIRQQMQDIARKPSA